MMPSRRSARVCVWPGLQGRGRTHCCDQPATPVCTSPALAQSSTWLPPLWLPTPSFTVAGGAEPRRACSLALACPTLQPSTHPTHPAPSTHPSTHPPLALQELDCTEPSITLTKTPANFTSKFRSAPE